MKIEHAILSSLVHDIEYSRKILPYLKEDYFADRTEKTLFEKIRQFTTKYNVNPTASALKVEIAALTGVSEDEHKKIAKLCLEVLGNTERPDSKWLTDTTEKFCKDKALYNAIAKSITIMDDKTGKESKNSIPEILREALSVTFDTHIGHDYIDNLEDRYEFYHRQESKIPFDIDIWNTITKNGWSNKTLNIIVAPTNGGKSIFLCHDAAAKLRFNKNVLYITCEMAEERIAERIDANMMNIDLDDISFLSKDDYVKKFGRATENIKGKLIVKEYPMCTASVIHFKHLLDELRIKKNFIPDIVYVDYLNICASARYKASAMVNSYTLIKAVAEELRGLAQELDIPIVTASQVNRCLDLGTEVITSRGVLPIGDLILGDCVFGDQGYNTVEEIFDQVNEVFEITLENGKTIICSGNHEFPTPDGLMSIDSGLEIGSSLITRNDT
jgi:replicative DNA helicase